MGAINIQSHLNLIGDNPININDFQILNFIASGGFSKVYKVKFKKSGRIFALKQISKSKIKKNYINFVFSEKEILSDLYNPFLINLYCTFQDQYNLYYIMDYLGGGDLRYYLLKKKKFNENQIKFILGCIIVSLEYIHSKKIIHRDIKPENLIFDDKGYLHLCDFGISIRENNEKKNIQKIGTKCFIAPEGNYTYLSDYYSIGVTLYEIIYCKIYDNNIDKEIIKCELENKGFSKELIDLINGLLEKNPKERLGFKKGINDLINHSFFKDFNFNKLKKQTMISPIIPKYDSIKMQKKYSKKISEYSTNEESSQEEFNNFDYICNNKVFEEYYSIYPNKFKVVKPKKSFSCSKIFVKKNPKLTLNNFYTSQKKIEKSIDCTLNYSNCSFISYRKNINKNKFTIKNNNINYYNNLFKNSSEDLFERKIGKSNRIIFPKILNQKLGKILRLQKLNPFERVKLIRRKSEKSVEL